MHHQTEVDLRERILLATMGAMHQIREDIPVEYFRKEADALISKWVKDHGEIGLREIADALVWWQETVSDANCFPCSKVRMN